MAEALVSALNELKHNVAVLTTQLENNVAASAALSTTINELQAEAKIVLEIVTTDMEALNNDKPNSAEKNQPLSPLYKSALSNHYLVMVTTLNAALTEQDREKQQRHTEKLKKLADISKPALKSALYALASLCFYMTSLITAAKASLLVALAPATTGASVVAAVPVAVVAGKMKKKADDFFSESEKQFHETMAVKNTKGKIKLKKSNK